MWRISFLLSLLVVLSVATPFSQVGRSAFVERRTPDGDSSDGPQLAVENGWVIDVSWLNQVPASRRPTINVPGLISNGKLIHPAPPGSKVGTPVGSDDTESSSSTADCENSSPTEPSLPSGAGASASGINDSSTGPTPTPQISSSLTRGSSTSIAGGGAPSSVVPNAASNPSSTTTPTGTSSNSTSTGTTSGASGCPPNMKGVTFNGGFNPGMFDTIAAATDWITFGLTGSSGGSAHAQAGYIPMMAFASDVAAAVSLVTGPSPPAWMLTFNEPDYSYGGVSPTMTAQQAADAIKPLLDAKPGKTQFVAPVTADPTSSWLDDFYSACDCKSFFAAYNIHIYTPTSDTVQSTLTTFHNKYNDKPIWLTEIAPGMANPSCSLGWDTVKTFMDDVYRFAAGSGWVDRVFWNTGNEIGPDDHNVCNSYLLDTGGNPSPLLADYQAVNCQ